MKTVASIRTFLLLTASILTLSAVAAGCSSSGGDDDEGKTSSELRLTLRTQPLPVESYEQFLTFDVQGGWKLNTSADWLLLSVPTTSGGSEEGDDESEGGTAGSQTLSGNGSQPVVLRSMANPDENSRTGQISLKAGSKSTLLNLSQEGTRSSEIQPGGQPSTTAGWMELPETDSSDGLDVFTVRFADGKRSYTFYWDYSTMVSNWVAYPLNSSLIGDKMKRTDAWAYCPLLPAAKQQNVSRGYADGNNGHYDRGHQLPSADRLGTFARNAQTFYGVNMTPQNTNFNCNLWATLEGRVRTWAKKTYTDTLYVVTGCVTEGARYYVYDASSRKITVPTAYFKALLLKEKESGSLYSSTSHYTATAFWFDHVEYSAEGKYNASLNKSMSISVKELEQKLGYELFVNLDDIVGTEMANKIKSENNIQW